LSFALQIETRLSRRAALWSGLLRVTLCTDRWPQGRGRRAYRDVFTACLCTAGQPSDPGTASRARPCAETVGRRDTADESTGMY